MRQHGIAGVIAFGVAALLGGVCALVYGLAHPGTTHVVGLGPLDGIWAAESYCFVGGVLVALGGGLTTFGLLVRSKPETTRVDRVSEPAGVVYSARPADRTEREAFRGEPDR